MSIVENFEEFCMKNQSWDSSFYGGVAYGREKDMMENYEIAKSVADAYYKRVESDILEPKIGDIVEFSDGFRIYKHAKIVEDLYFERNRGMLCICENGSSHLTKDAGFSTSGGAFVRRHKSRLEYSGNDENIVWTWGCNGPGASQGIYFTLKVNKWIIPYDEKFIVKSTVKINGAGKKNLNGEKLPAVIVQNSDNWAYSFQTFDTIKAYNAWAEYIGYKTVQRESCLDLISNQRLVQKYIVKDEDIPKGAKMIKRVSNGRVRDCWVTTDGNDIVFHTDNRSIPERKYGTKEDEEETRMFRKYSDNPLGV